MKLETLQKLLRTKNSEAICQWQLKDGKQTSSIQIIYRPNSKVYTYKGYTVFKLAEILGLIPEVDYLKESERILKELLTGNDAIGFAGCSDTLNYLLFSKVEYQDFTVDTENLGKNEYSQYLQSYKLVKKSESKNKNWFN